ncbi:hypothetical protein RBB50_009510 [Rhinocladiella similis]
MRSISLFLTSAAFGLARATYSEADVTVTVTSTRVHSICPATTITTCAAAPTIETGSTKPTTLNSADVGNAENNWASQWEAQKTNYAGPWNDWSLTVSGPGVPTSVPSTSVSESTTSNENGGKPTGSTTSATYSYSPPPYGYNTTSTTGSLTSTTSASLTSTTSSSFTGCPTYTPAHNASDFCNSAADRSKWCGGQDISSNCYTNGFKTGRTVRYTLTIDNTTMSYDGTAPKVALTVNGQVPGPVIEANWGDMVEVTVINNLHDNATSIHWHGIRQLGTNDQDGVPGVTECAVAGYGGSRTYTWHASSYGTSWYHSHALAQYGDGVRGPIVIHGPATANYDIDMGTVMIDDTFANAVGTQADLITHYGPGGSFNTLFNGKNINPVGPGGKPFEWTVTPCRKHLFRIINSSSQNMYVVGFDAHNLTVIAADFVPIVPYTTPYLNIGIGQRYDVIVEMNQPIGSYYVRAVIQTGCPSGGANSGLGTANAIMNYQGSNSTPVTNTPITNITAASCIDEPLASLVPYVSLPAGDSGKFQSSVQTLPAGQVTQVQTSTDGLVYQWFINNGVMNVNYSMSTLEKLDSGLNGSTFSNPVVLDQANEWVYFVIQNQFFASHPMHIHGHDVSVLGTGTGPWSSDLTSTLNFKNPMRRDTVMLQGSAGPGNPAGYTVIGFETDNPGAWVMHCHILWHVDDGLALQFIERPDDIVKAAYSSKQSFQDECAALRSYEAANPQSVRTEGESGMRKRTTLEGLGVSNNYAGLKRHHALSHKRYAGRHFHGY